MIGHPIHAIHPCHPSMPSIHAIHPSMPSIHAIHPSMPSIHAIHAIHPPILYFYLFHWGPRATTRVPPTLDEAGSIKFYGPKITGLRKYLPFNSIDSRGSREDKSRPKLKSGSELLAPSLISTFVEAGSID